MKKIPLMGNAGKGKYALVDDEDYEVLSWFRWNYSSGYAYSVPRKGFKPLKMHRLILGQTDRNRVVDHINLNKLDNRRNNIIIVSTGQNALRRSKNRINTSGHKGVGFHKATGLWQAYFKHQGKQVSLGFYKDPIHASIAYNVAAKLLYGEFAACNPIPIEDNWLEKGDK